MQYGIKEAARHFTAPTVGNFNAAVRLSRYLLGTRDYVMNLEPNDKQQLVVYPDLDWGAQKETRRSTNGILVLYAGCVVQNLSRTQGTAAGSSGEAEFYAIGSGATEALGAASILADLGVRLTPVLYSDASAGISLPRRQGFWKSPTHRVEVFDGARLARGAKALRAKGKKEKNPADILTKAVDTATLLRHLETCGLANKKTSNSNVLEIVASVSADTVAISIAVGIGIVTAGAFCATRCWRENVPANTSTSELARADAFEVGTQSQTTYTRDSKNPRFKPFADDKQGAWRG
jgi:hypothetical protein